MSSESEKHMDMNPKKKIMILVQTLTGGGAEHVAADLSIGLSQYYEVTLVVFSKSTNEYPHCENAIYLNLKGNNILSKVITVFRRIYRVHKLKKQYKIDCTISFLSNADIVNVFSSLKDKRIVSIRANLENSHGNLPSIMQKIVFMASNHIVSLSEGSRISAARRYKIPDRKLTVIYNACNIKSQLQTETNDLSINCDGKVIVSLGSMRHQKGQWHLIKAFNLIHNVQPDVHLLLLGDGAYREKLTQLVSILDLEKYVHMPGFVSNPYMLMSKCNLFVLSSISEGFSNSILEAMSCGLPVVCSDCHYGPREIITPSADPLKTVEEVVYGEYGVLVPPFDNSPIDIALPPNKQEMQLADAILELLGNDELRQTYVKCGLDRIRDFSTEKNCEMWHTCIEKMCK